jgi:Fe-S-cluster-containing dehydrogenase component
MPRPAPGPPVRALAPARRPVRFAKVLDQSRCIGCHACTTACKSENAVPLGVSRTYVKSVEVGRFPNARRAFQVTRCNQCEDAPCVRICPTGAMYQRPDGIVDFDKSICIGCKACMAACPYDAIFINPDDHSAEKCNFCAHRLEVGLEPACVVVCPTEAILVGDLHDPASKVARIVGRQPVAVRRPEKARPKVFYVGAQQHTLDPLAARRPPGPTLAWASAPPKGTVASGHPGQANSSAEAVVSYDVGHARPWGFRVSHYTWTKGVAAGVELVVLGLVLAGRLGWASPLVRLAAPAVALGFLGLTGYLLVSDLKHPLRFYLLFTHPQPRSWLVRGGVILAAYEAALVFALSAGLARSVGAEQVAAGLVVPLSLAAACYTAFLFAQAKARDLWQNPLVAPHLAVQAALVGSAAALALSLGLSVPVLHPLEVVLAAACGAHVALVLGEVTLTHATAHTHLAVHELVRGRYAPWFLAGLLAVAAGIAAPFAGVGLAFVAAVGVFLHEHAYVQAGQAVPLA